MMMVCMIFTEPLVAVSGQKQSLVNGNNQPEALIPGPLDFPLANEASFLPRVIDTLSAPDIA